MVMSNDIWVINIREEFRIVLEALVPSEERIGESCLLNCTIEEVREAEDESGEFKVEVWDFNTFVEPSCLVGTTQSSIHSVFVHFPHQFDPFLHLFVAYLSAHKGGSNKPENHILSLQFEES
jgi:hypothetical protein